MITVRLINETGIASADMDTLTAVTQHYTPIVTAPWKLADVKVINGGTPVAGDWVIYLTERKRHTGASGYHSFENGSPVAYCSPRAAGRLFGTYIKPLVLKGKQIHGALYTPGLITTICHELAEMLCDQNISTVSGADSLGRNWLVEVCDPVFGFYSNYPVGKTNCVLPDVVTPAFYTTSGVAPFSILGGATAAFKLAPKGYAYYKDSTGKLIKI
jgi:hypothetical protein